VHASTVSGEIQSSPGQRPRSWGRRLAAR